MRCSARSKPRNITGTPSTRAYGLSATACPSYKHNERYRTLTAQKGDSIANDGIFICYAPFDDPEIANGHRRSEGRRGRKLPVIAQEILEAYFSLKSATDVTDVEGELLQ